MQEPGITGVTLIILNLIFFCAGQHESFFHKYKLKSGYPKTLSFLIAPFLHGNYIHLIFNLLNLFFFSSLFELQIGQLKFCVLYCISLIVSNYFFLYFNRKSLSNSLVGASGAISGLTFAAIILHPWFWFYGGIYLLSTVYGMKDFNEYSARNIAHEAHLGGAVAGIIFSVCFL